MTGQRAFWVGLAASAALLGAFAYLFLPKDDIGDVISTANLWYVIPSLVFYFLAVGARTARWRFILHPLIGTPKRSLYPVVVIGYMANNILPIRLGEVVRSYYASVREPISAGAAFGTIAVERATDVVALLFFIAAVSVFLPTSALLEDLANDVPGGTPVLIFLSVAPFVSVIGVMAVVTVASPERVLSLVGFFLVPLPAGLREKFVLLAERLIEGLTVLRSPRALAAVMLLSLPVWLLEAAMILIIALGFDLQDAFATDTEFVAAMLLFMATANLAGIVPSVSGGVGPFEFFGAATLVALGVADAEAGAFALTVHVALLVPVTVLGGVLLLLDGTSIRALLRHAQTTDVSNGAAPANSTMPASIPTEDAPGANG